jgi:hippurate hydrolase
MAASARFEVTVRGQGGHASQPSLTRDPVLTACQCVTELQSIISRETDFSSPAVLSVCQLSAGTASNIIPDLATFAGTVRTWNDEQSDTIGRRIGEISSAVAGAHGCTAETVWDRYYPVTRNHADETVLVQEVGTELFGEGNVTDDGLPMMGAEDFSFYLQQRPGCFFFLGGGGAGRTNAVCHSTAYDFNDDLILRGVRCYLRIVEKTLGCELT